MNREIIERTDYELKTMGFNKTLLGYLYETKGGKSFIAENTNRIPKYKTNAIQLFLDDKAMVLDKDSKKIKLPCNLPEDTVCSITPRGEHYWFLRDHRIKATVNTKLKIDILTGDNPVIVPPSVVDGGKPYRWKVRLQKLCDLKPMDEELIQWLLEYQQPKTFKAELCRNQLPSADYKSISELSTKQKTILFSNLELCRAASIGTRSEYDFSFVQWGISCGLDKLTIWAHCKEVSKFKENGFKYFERTYNAALRSVRRV